MLANTSQPADLEYACLRPRISFYIKPESPLFQKEPQKRSPALQAVLENEPLKALC